MTRVHKPFWLHQSHIPYMMGKAFGFTNLFVPYIESIHFETYYDIGKNLADIMTDFSNLLYLLAAYNADAFLLMPRLHFD